jgi:hypothetical protein
MSLAERCGASMAQQPARARHSRGYSSIRRACRTISLPHSNCLAHYSPKPCQNSSYRCYDGCCGTLFLSFALLAAAPFQAQAREERSVPPLPIPHVTRTAAVHYKQLRHCCRCRGHDLHRPPGQRHLLHRRERWFR